MKHFWQAVQGNTDIAAIAVLVVVFALGGDRTLSRALGPVLQHSFLPLAGRAVLLWERGPRPAAPCLPSAER